MNANESCHGCTEAIALIGGLANSGSAMNIRVYLCSSAADYIFLGLAGPALTESIPTFITCDMTSRAGKPPGEWRVLARNLLYFAVAAASRRRVSVRYTAVGGRAE